MATFISYIKLNWPLIFNLSVISFILFYFSDIPFFGDVVAFSEAAYFFYTHNLNSLILPQNLDAGGFPLYSLYLSIVWKLFGKTLLVSHLAILPFILGTIIEFYKLSKRYLSKRASIVCIALLLIEPTFLTQSILMSYDLITLYAFLICINALLDKDKFGLVSGLTLALFSNIRGIEVLISIVVADIIINKRDALKRLLPYILSSAVFFLWLSFHYYKTGWLLFNPLRSGTHEELENIVMIFKRLGFALWKIADFGRISWCLLAAISIFFLYFKYKTAIRKNIPLLLFLVCTFISIIFVLPFAVPVTHRYFMIVYLLGILYSCYFMEQYIFKKQFKIILTIIIGSSFLFGNFILYPQRFGNGWDSSLKVLSLFPLQDELFSYIKQNNIPAEEVATEFPLSFDQHYWKLSKEHFKLQDLDTNNIDNYNYYLSSNIINTAFPARTKEIEDNWKMIKTFEKGQVSLRLYRK